MITNGEVLVVLFNYYQEMCRIHRYGLILIPNLTTIKKKIIKPLKIFC